MKALYGSILLLFVIVGASAVLSSQEGFDATSPPATGASPRMPVTSSALVSATKTFRPASVTGPSSAPLASADLTSPSAPSVVSLSEMGYEAMSLKQRSNLLKEIQMMVRNELLSSRQLEKPDQKMDEYEDEEVMDGACPSAYQGEDYKRRSPQGEAEAESDHYRYSKNSNGSCPPVPDLSDYIRKDSIPCWGCSLK